MRKEFTTAGNKSISEAEIELISLSVADEMRKLKALRGGRKDHGNK